MIFYHIDHRNRLQPNMRLEPNTMRLSSGPWLTDVYLSLSKTFPAGLSHFGEMALYPTTDPHIASQHTLEFILEMVRLASFPRLPSRLSSVFGTRDMPASYDRWLERLGADAATFRVFECESDRVYTVDAACLDLPSLADFVPNRASRPEQPPDTDSAILSFPAVHIHAARQYWLSCRLLEDHPPADPASTDIAQAQCNPPTLEELLAPGPVRVLRQVWP